MILEAAEALERWNDVLARHPGPRPQGPFDDNSVIHGPLNPIAPPAHLEMTEGRVQGTVVLGKQYQGGPGWSHGGVIAELFDDILGTVQLTTGQGGPTGTLTVKYRRPTPINKELHFEARVDRVDGRKIDVSGMLSDDEGVCAEATAICIGRRAD